MKEERDESDEEIVGRWKEGSRVSSRDEVRKEKMKGERNN